MHSKTLILLGFSATLLACSAKTPPADVPLIAAAAAAPASGASPAADPPGPPAGVRADVDVATLKQRLDADPALVLVDVRTPGEYEAGHVPGARLLPIQELESRVEELRPLQDREIHVICQSGGRSSRAADELVQAGFPRVTNVKGGTAAWRGAGYPVDGAPAPPAP
jgi:rhodanese-related sulfurtransferase